MSKKTLPKSLRKYIRLEKARIRRGASDMQEEKDAIAKMYAKLGSLTSKKEANLPHRA